MKMHYFTQQAINSIPEFGQRYEKFRTKMHLSQYSKGTIAAYCSKLCHVTVSLGKLPENLTQYELDDYLLKLQQDNPEAQNSMFQHVIFALRTYYKLMGFPNKINGLPRLRKRKTLPVVFSENEVCRLLSHGGSLRNKSILSLLYSAGLRTQEVCNLCVQDIDCERNRIHIRQSKNKKDRLVVLGDTLWLYLKKYMEVFKPQDILFYGKTKDTPLLTSEVRPIFNQAKIDAGIDKKATCHTLRHSYATHLLERGVSIVLVSRLLGHANIKTTMVYLHVANVDDGHLFNPLDKLFPIK